MRPRRRSLEITVRVAEAGEEHAEEDYGSDPTVPTIPSLP